MGLEFYGNVVEKEKMLSNKKVTKGDILVGLPSSGLHTNGYSLARKVLLDKYKIGEYIEELGCSVDQELLKIHKSYLHILFALMDLIQTGVYQQTMY